MNRKQLGILLVLVVVVGAIGWMVFNKQKEAGAAGNLGIGRKLLKDFPVNDIARVTIRLGTNEVNLVRKDELWRVSERQDYPANFSELSTFLLKLRDLKTVQTEEVGASQLPRLQLAPGQGTNSPTVVEFKAQDGKTINSLQLGKLHMNSGRGAGPMGGEGGWPDGRYVLVGANSASVAVISDPLENIQPKPEQWLNKEFLKVEKAKSVEVTFPVATNSWKLMRETDSGDWKLADAKPEEQLDSTKASSISNPLNAPSFSDVLPGSQLELGATNQPTVVKIETFEGFNYTVQVGARRNDDYLVTFAVAAQLPKERVAGKDEKAEDKAKLDKEFKDRQQKLEEKLKQEQAYGKWTYLVPTWTIDPIIKERSQLLVDKKAETAAASGANTNSAESAETPKLEDPAMPAVKPKP